ncbi:hypothetical protein PTKIN_Ptkin13bG0251500 [Pterospermum kingtungense]
MAVEPSVEISLPDKEETDQLVRSNKKIKRDKGAVDTELDLPDVDVNQDSRDDVSRRKVSFRDAVLSSKNSFRESFQGMGHDIGDKVSDDDMDDGDEGDEECPTIHVTVQEKIRLRKQWSKALIIKLVRHTVGYNFLIWRLKALWQIPSSMDVIDVGKYIYVVRFQKADEYERALYDGPW